MSARNEWAILSPGENCQTCLECARDVHKVPGFDLVQKGRAKIDLVAEVGIPKQSEDRGPLGLSNDPEVQTVNRWRRCL